MNYDWLTPCSYNPEQKKIFHAGAKRQLRQLAKKLHFDSVDYDIRSNQGGIAVSGEITLHHEKVYIQVSQGSIGILIRTCNGRKDYTGGPNTFVPLTDLDDDLTNITTHVERILNS